MSYSQWIEEVDRRLAALLREEARLSYLADATGVFDERGLEKVSSQRIELLARDETVSKARLASLECRDARIRRMARLLEHTALLSRINDAPELVRLRNELEGAQRRCAGTLHTAAGLEAYLSKTEPLARERLKVSNELARSNGFEDYPEAVLTCQEWSRGALLEMIEGLLARHAHLAHAVVREANPSCLSPQHVEAAAHRRLAFADEAFPASRIERVAADTLGEFDVSLAGFGITLEEADLPYAGAVHVLSVGEDIRIVINGRRDGFRRYSLFFHELGHALYYAYAPKEALLIDNRIAREGLAEMWAGLIERRQWLARYTPLGASEIDALVENARRSRACVLVSRAREVLFEMELYANPAADFAEVWDRMTTRCLGLKDDSRLYSEFVFLWPLDIKDYVIADCIKNTLIARLEARFGADLHAPRVMDCLVSTFYRPGNMLPWRRMLDGDD